MAVELGITDYLHEIELWRQRLEHWRQNLPEPEGVEARACVEKLFQFGDEAASQCRLLRQKVGFEEGLDQGLCESQSFETVETELGLSIWQIMREEERLRSLAPRRSLPLPPGLPRARLRVQR